MVDLVYIDDLIEDFNPADFGTPGSRADLVNAIDDDRLRPAIEQLRPQGMVSFGMCSGYEFVEL